MLAWHKGTSCSSSSTNLSPLFSTSSPASCTWYDLVIIPCATLLREYLHAAASHWPIPAADRSLLSRADQDRQPTRTHTCTHQVHSADPQTSSWHPSITCYCPSDIIGEIVEVRHMYRSSKWGCAFCPPDISWALFVCCCCSSLDTM